MQLGVIFFKHLFDSQQNQRQFVEAYYSIEDIDRQIDRQIDRYCALVDTTYEILWLLQLLQDLVVLIAYATPINCDTLSAIQIAHNNEFHKR